MTKQQAPAPKPKKIPRKLPSRGMYIDFLPRNVKPAVSRPEEAEAAEKPAKRPKPAVSRMPKMATPEKPPVVRVSRNTVISTTKEKAPRRDFRPPAKEEDFDDDLLSDLDFEENSTPVFTDEELEALEGAFSPDAPEETPEDFMAEKSADEYATALTALKVTSVEESPFIASVSVDKRPLSEGRRLVEEDDSKIPASIREENFNSPVKNVYTRRPTPEKTAEAFDPLSRGAGASRRHIIPEDDDIEPKLRSIKSKELREKEAKIGGHDRDGTRIISPKDGHSGPFALIIAITLMVIFGGAVGAVIYLAFFQ